MQFSRGCPHPCNYCGQRGFWTRFRHRDPKKFAAEIAWLHRVHGVEVIPASKLPLITQAAIDGCDRQKGVKDGFFDSAACRFDPADLLCSGGDTSSCLTAPQVATVVGIWKKNLDNPVYRDVVRQLKNEHAEVSRQVLDAEARRSLRAQLRRAEEARDRAPMEAFENLIAELSDRGVLPEHAEHRGGAASFGTDDQEGGQHPGAAGRPAGRAR